ncbi:MAG: ATP-binding protein, partial [Kiritimatiellae bacterium]|nr:ATP-binding protein [Kiritimatiellia bacterium]
MKSVSILLRSLCLGEMAGRCDEITEKAGQEGWSHERYLRELCELEITRRAQRRTERLLKESHLPDGKTLATLDQERLPLKVRRQVPTLLEGRFVEETENILAFG